MQQVTADPLIGRLLEGRYRILDRIARGGMSTVYAAVDERLDRRVAVKVMASSLSSDPKFTDRFSREARAAARLTHVNAVSVYDQGIDNSGGSSHVFLVMELVQGRTLRDLIRERQGRFTPAEAVSIMEPVLSALSAAHRAGLVHRDVKPENILLSDDGLVKVADFGLARAVDADAASTRTGLMMGTVAYCAPEQIVHGRSDQRSDVYSAGIVLFELLTGRPPYQGDSAMNVAYQHVHSRVPAPSSRSKGVPNEIDEIVVAATDSDPGARPSDASAFLAELADARTELSLPVVPIPPRPRNGSGGPGQNGAGQNGHGQNGHGPSGAPRSGRPHQTGSTRPVRGGPPVDAAGAPTDLLQHPSFPGHDTRIVGDRPSRAGEAPPPPVVIPPSKRGGIPRTPRERRRRRRLIALIVVLLVGALSVTGGFVGVHLFREWNTHVPKVAGVTAREATQKLLDSGYKVNPAVTSEFSETVPEGVVIRTDPAAGERLSRGGTVRLVVSLGQDRVPVPPVHNMSLADAESALADRGLTVAGFTTRHSIKVKQGNVIATDPRAGVQVKRGQAITIIQSDGPPNFAVPDIAANTSYDAAAAAITAVKNANFQVSRSDDYSDTVPAGDVISVSPSGKVPYGSTINLVVSKGPKSVPVPDYAPLSSVSDLEAQLDQLGVAYTVNPVFGGDQQRVLSTDPPSGTLVRPGVDTVTITVY